MTSREKHNLQQEAAQALWQETADVGQSLSHLRSLVAADPVLRAVAHQNAAEQAVVPRETLASVSQLDEYRQRSTAAPSYPVAPSPVAATPPVVLNPVTAAQQEVAAALAEQAGFELPEEYRAA